MDTIRDRVRAVRQATEHLCAHLGAEDLVVQSMPDASPGKWHLAHTTWFFETFVLTGFAPGHAPFHTRYGYLFNSYYNAIGARHARPRRGMLTRPTLAEILAYRRFVDSALDRFLAEDPGPEVEAIVTLGLHHEQQHQELMLTDQQHALSCNPLLPAWREGQAPALGVAAPPLRWTGFPAGVRQVGHRGDGFCFDNETPRHATYVAAFDLANRTVTNGEYLAFVRDGGYLRPELWLDEGWRFVQSEGWSGPLYWTDDGDRVRHYTLGGERDLDPGEPVCHVSLYEADAYARWAGARLPTEFEWETAAEGVAVTGNLADAGRLHPAAAPDPGLTQLYGDVWEWTSSSYAAYPGFRAVEGAIGEYNGKFMVNQYVLRGGSCFTPAGHVRPSYRNFFPAHARWQMSGIRLARDVAHG